MLCLFLTACKKEIPEPDVIRLQVYNTKIKYTNHSEPDILNWYIRPANKGGYFYLATTSNLNDFTGLKFSYCPDLPDDLKGKAVVKDIVVWINQLNGDMFFDIMGRNATTTAEQL